MKKEKMPFLYNVLLPNFGIKILSLVGAILVWLVIININDPYRTKTFQVSVETINENVLTSVNKVFEITSGEIASVRVSGKRSVIDKLDATDIRATADLSHLSSVNAVTIKPSLRKKLSSDVSLECSDVLKVSLENMATKQLKITVVTEGTAADGYSVGECTAKPNIIRVSGGESTIRQIETVKVFLNIDGVSEDFNSRLEPVAFDDNDKAVTSSTLSFSDTKIRVRARILENKTVPVRIDITGTPAVGYEYVETECLPTEIEVAGSAKRLASISEVKIPIDIGGLTDSSSALEQTINIHDYLKIDGITVPEEYETISVKITIERKLTRQVEVLFQDIQFKNLDKNMVAGIEEVGKSILLTLSGRESVIKDLQESSLIAYIDCENREEGTYPLLVQMDLKDNCEILDPPKLHVKISKESDHKDSVTGGTDAATTPPQASHTQRPEHTDNPEPVSTPEATPTVSPVKEE